MCRELCPCCFFSGNVQRLTTDTVRYWCQFCNRTWPAKVNLHISWVNVIAQIYAKAPEVVYVRA